MSRGLQHYLGHKNIQHTVRYSDIPSYRPTDFAIFGRTEAN
jgi:hypothetical protein